VYVCVTSSSLSYVNNGGLSIGAFWNSGAAGLGFVLSKGLENYRGNMGWEKANPQLEKNWQWLNEDGGYTHTKVEAKKADPDPSKESISDTIIETITFCLWDFPFWARDKLVEKAGGQFKGMSFSSAPEKCN